MAIGYDSEYSKPERIYNYPYNHPWFFTDKNKERFRKRMEVLLQEYGELQQAQDKPPIDN